MAEKKKLMEQTRKNIKSCVLPEKNGILLMKLNMSFKGFFGFDIPYRKLDYGSLQNLLEDMSDIIELVFLWDNNIIVKARPTEDTQHISEMVAKQRNSDSGYGKHTQMVLDRNAHRQQAIRASKTVVVPHEIQDNCLKVLRHNRNGLSAAAFSREYKRFFNQDLKSQNYGYDSLDDFFCSMSRIVDVKNDYQGNLFMLPTDDYKNIWEMEDKKNRSRLLNESQGARPKSSREGSGNCVIPEDVKEKLRKMMSSPAVAGGGIPLHRLRQDYQDYFSQKLEYIDFGFSSAADFCKSLPEIFDIRFSNIRNQTTHRLFPSESIKSSSGSFERSFSQSSIKSAPTNRTNFTSKVMDNISCLLRQTGTVSMFDLRDKYLEYYGDELCVGSDGVSLQDLLKKMVDFDIIELSNSDPFGSHPPSLNISLSLKQRQLLDRHLNPRPSNTGNVPFEIVRGESLTVQTVSEPPDGFLDVYVGDIISPTKFYVRLIGEQCSGALVKLESEMSEFYSKCSRDRTLRPSPTSLAALNLVAVHFPMDNVIWHRALVKRIFDLSAPEVEAEVFLVDSGSKVTVGIRDLRWLTHPFAQLPGQAIEARCANIEPKCLKCTPSFKCLRCKERNGLKRTWSQAAKKYFVELIKNSRGEGLVAMYKGIQRSLSPLLKVEKVSLILIDTVSNNFEGGININEELIRMNFAVVQNESRNNIDSLKIASNLVKNEEFNDTIKTPSVRMTVKETQQDGGDQKPFTLDLSEFRADKSIDEHTSRSAKTSFRSNKSVGSNVSSRIDSRIAKPLEATASVAKMSEKPMSVASHPNKSAQSSEVPWDSPDLVPLQLPRSQEDAEEENMSIELAELTDQYKVNIIGISGTAYVSSAEISALFPRWRGQDLLAKMLKLRGEKLSNVQFNSKDHQWFFERCIIENVGGIETVDGEIVDKMTLYPLEYVPIIYQLFGGNNVDPGLLQAMDKLAR